MNHHDILLFLHLLLTYKNQRHIYVFYLICLIRVRPLLSLYLHLCRLRFCRLIWINCLRLLSHVLIVQIVNKNIIDRLVWNSLDALLLPCFCCSFNKVLPFYFLRVDSLLKLKYFNYINVNFFYYFIIYNKNIKIRKKFINIIIIS